MKAPRRSRDEIRIVSFSTPKAWMSWLEKNHAKSSGVWLKIAKRASGNPSVSYEEALDGALCYGWIDSQKKGYDEEAWLQKFTPRGATSRWSKANQEKVQRLIEAGKMRPAGLQAIQRAKRGGQWAAAYDRQSVAQVPPDLQAEFEAHPKARQFFDGLNSVNRYAILYRIQTAKKSETRARRIQQFIEMLENGEKIYP